MAGRPTPPWAPLPRLSSVPQPPNSRADNKNLTSAFQLTMRVPHIIALLAVSPSEGTSIDSCKQRHLLRLLTHFATSTDFRHLLQSIKHKTDLPCCGPSSFWRIRQSNQVPSSSLALVAILQHMSQTLTLSAVAWYLRHQLSLPCLYPKVNSFNLAVLICLGNPYEVSDFLSVSRTPEFLP